MARKRNSENDHLPRYVYISHGSYFYRPPNTKPQKVCRVGEESKLFMFMADTYEPVGTLIYMEDLFDRYVREVVPGMAPRTQVDYKRIIAKLRIVFEGVKPDDVQPKHVGQLMDVTKGKIAANRMAAVLSGVFSKAVGKWYVAERNPCIGVERNPTKKRKRYVTDAEFAIVYDHASPRMKLAMDLALITAQRQGDLIDLKWTDVQTIGVPRAEWGIYFQQGKTGKRLLVTISPALEEVLTRARKMTPQIPRNYVLRTEEGLRYTRDGFRTNWQRLMKWALKHGGLGERFTFHDLRRKSISDAKSVQEGYERAGHTSIALTRGVYDQGIRRVIPLK
jgi:integrase